MSRIISDLIESLEKSARVANSATFEERLSRWAAPPSQTEQDKCDRAERMIRQAIEEDEKLSQMNISVYAKGSYANRTNIPSDSDVDVAVVHNELFMNTFPEGTSREDFDFVAADYSFSDFKKDVHTAIQNKFGSENVIDDDKCVKVRPNTCRVDADVVPHFIHRRYSKDKSYVEGVAFRCNGIKTYNWPKQDYDNGVAKNAATNKSYKGLVRILKSIRSEMKDEKINSADVGKSYLLACLVWNVPNYVFESDTYEKILDDALVYLIGKTAAEDEVKEWGEVNELKYLFRSSQPWKLAAVNGFLKDARKFVERYK